MNKTIGILLTIHNQEQLAPIIFDGIVNNISPNVTLITIIFDGCTDRSEEVLKDKVSINCGAFVETFNTPNLNETLANNYGLKISPCDYTIIVQDDCLIQEKNFDQRMLKPFLAVPELIAVSGRDAVDTRLLNGRLDYYNVGGKDVPHSRDIFYIRDAVNRSPLMLDMKKLKELNYLDEDFAPLDSDDVDLCIRAYKQFGYLSGAYVINFSSPLNWGTTRRNPISAKIWEESMKKNHNFIVQRHYDFIVGEKHSKDMELK